MTEEKQTLAALEQLISRLAGATNVLWIDNVLIEMLALASSDPSKREISLRVVLILFEARQRLIAQQSSRPPSSPEATNSLDDDAAKKELIAKAVLDERGMDRAKSYEQIIVGLGYGAALALWGTMGPKLPRGEMLLSGGLLGLSLIIYICFHIAALIWMNIWQLRLNEIVANNDSFAQRNANFDEKIAERYKSYRGFLRIWIVIFPIQVILGIGGSLTLVLAALASVLG